MANANLPNPTNGAGPVPFGDVSPEDAEKFAASFTPMWELDDAPFAAGPANMNAGDVQRLGSVNGNRDLMAAMHAPITAPLASPAPAPKQARPAGRPPAARGPAPAAAIPQRATGRDASVDLDLRSLRKSNKGIVLALGGVVAAVALFFGVRAALSGPDTPAAALPTASAISHDEPKIPPPPAPEPPSASTAAAVATTAAAAVVAAPDPPKPEPARVDPPKPAPVQVARPEPPPPPPPRAAVPHYNPPPRAPAAPPKKPTSGIVRDNPF